MNASVEFGPAASAAEQGGTAKTHGWASSWNRFWFTPADPYPLAMVRIGTGLILAWASFVWLLDAEAFFGPAGWLPAHEVWRMNDQPWQWSWYFATSSSAVRLSLGILTMISGLTLAAGLATRLSAVVALAGLISAANRAPLNVFGLDDTLGMLLISLVIGPAGACLSIDCWLQGRLLGRGCHDRPGQGGRHAAQHPSSVLANLSIRLLQCHLCVVYFFSGAGKLLGASWWEGMALWGAAANDQYRTLDLTWIADKPLLINAVTLTTLFWEVAYAAIIWPRLTRPFAIGMAIAVHLGIGLAMGMMEFGLAMIVANLAFVPAATWRRWTRAGMPARVEEVRPKSLSGVGST
jgi:uncharacterized membrane protein YphA (DoxX/SURF4 family)